MENNKNAVIYIRDDDGNRKVIQHHGVGGISLQDGALVVLRYGGSLFGVMALYNRDEWVTAELVE
jgi:hypothetical protein